MPAAVERVLRAAAALLLSAGVAGAQDAEDAEAAGAAAPPRPAMMAQLSSRAILLSLERAGPRLVTVGERGNILVSEDGVRWRQVDAPVDVMLNRVRFRDDRNGWAVGHDAAILATADGGLTWRLQHFEPGGRALYDVFSLRDGGAIAVGGYGTYLVASAGGEWRAHADALTELAQHLNAIERLGDDSLLIAGERGLLARSTDEGQSWTLLDSPYVGSFFGVLPLGPKGFIAYGLRGNLYACTDAGSAGTLSPEGYDPFERQTVTDAGVLAAGGWKRLDSGTTETLFGHGRAADAFLVVGVNGVALRVDAGSGEVTRLQSPAGETLSDVHWDGRGWLAVGRRGIQSLGALAWR